MNNYMYLVPIAAVIALLFAAYLAGKVGKTGCRYGPHERDCRRNRGGRKSFPHG